MSETPDELTQAFVHQSDSGATPDGVPRVPGLTVLRELGRGGMGRVFLARHARLKREVALKVMLGCAPTDLARFRAEAAAAASITHPNVISVHESGEAGGQPYLVLEYAPGGTLDARLRLGRPPLAEAARLMEQVARGVAAAHLRGVVHRDLKPANVLLGADGTPKVGDFGLAKAADATEAGVTRTNQAVGTPGFMPPEQARGDAEVGPPADVWALGVMLYALLTGARPFRGPTPDAVLHAVLFAEPARPRAADRSIPRDLETICLKCLAKSPGDRYPDAGHLADDLARWRNVEPIAAKSVSALERAGKWARRNPAVASLMAAVLLAAVAAGRFGLVAREEAARADARTADATAALLEARRQKAAAEDMLTAVQLDRAQQLWREQPADALAALAQVRAGHRDRFEFRLLDRLTRRTGQHTLDGHAGAVLSAAWSPDGHALATAGWDRTARVWDARTGASTLVLKPGAGPLTGAALSPDGTRLAAACGDGTARVWDARAGAGALALPAHGASAVAWSPDGRRLVTASADGLARVWDARSGGEPLALRGHAGPVTAASFAPDGSRVVASGRDRTVRVWDAKTGVELLTLRGHGEWANSAAFSPDGTRIAAAGQDRTARVWDARTGVELLILRGHRAAVGAASWSPDGSRLVTAGWDNLARVWDTRTGADLFALRGHTAPVTHAAWSPDGLAIATVSADGTARLWDARSGNEPPALRGHAGKLWAASWSPDGSRLATGGSDRSARVWDAATGAEVLALRGHGGTVAGAAFAPDGLRVVTASWDGTARVWDALTGVETLVLRGHGKVVYAAAWSPDGSRLLTAGGDGTARVWDAKTGVETLVLRGHGKPVVAAAWSPDGRRLATSGDDRAARVWDARTGAELFTLRGHTNRVAAVAWSPDGRWLATAGWDNLVRVWDAETGAEALALRGHTNPVASVAWSPDSSRLATAGQDGSARLWDAATGAEALALRGHADGVTSAAWRPDGGCLATAGADGAVRLWDARPGPAYPFPANPSWLRWELAAARKAGDHARAVWLGHALSPADRAAAIADARKAEPDAAGWKLAEAYDRLDAGRPLDPPPGDDARSLALCAWAGPARAAAALPAAEARAASSGSPDDRLTVGVLQLRAGRLEDAARTLAEVLQTRGRACPECEYALAELARQRGDPAAARDWLARGDSLGVAGGDWRDAVRLRAWRRGLAVAYSGNTRTIRS